VKPARFDVVLCNGVLHHTADPFGGFSGLVPLLKPGGIFVVGLYNQLGRLGMDLRRHVLRATGGRAAWIDPHLRSTRMSAAKRRAWLADQYRHPHESKHTMGEILGWFSRCGLELVRGVPALSWVDDDLGESGLFSQGSAGSVLSRAAAQVRMISAGNREGGFFIMIGRKTSDGDQGETTEGSGSGG
jgi:SAM-dependent methyltransferase